MAKALTFTQIKALKPKDKLYKLSDGGGLSLWVYPTGRMRWALQYREDDKQKTAYLGEYPAYSLADAREWRVELKKRQAKNLSVVDASLKDSAYLFQNVYHEWFIRWAPQKKSEKYVKQVKAAIDSNVLSLLYNKDVRNIKPVDIVQALRTMEERGVLEYLRRVKSSLKMLFGYAAGSGLIDFNPVSAIDDQAFMKPQKSHFDTLAPHELHLLIDALENKINGVTRGAIYWQLLTMTRPIETVSAQWKDLDLKNKQWIIPAEVMKKSRSHIVPLCDELIALLPEIKAMNQWGKYLFEGVDYVEHLNREIPRITLRKAGLPTTAHGLRALSATILEEQGFPEAVIKSALSHAKGNGDQTTAAYLRSTFYNERVEMMKCLNDIVVTTKNELKKKSE